MNCGERAGFCLYSITNRSCSKHLRSHDLANLCKKQVESNKLLSSITVIANLNMQHYRDAALRRTPPPDGVRASSSPPPALSPPSSRPPINSEFLIIGLFALRLTKRLIEGLENYLERNADIAWLRNFLAPYPLEYTLAKVSGSRKDNYIASYQTIVSRMKRQPRYPMRFMQMNPDRSQQPGQGRRESEDREKRSREMTDRELFKSTQLY
jgi:hypothetical protein